VVRVSMTLTLALLSACHGGNATSPVSPPPPPPPPPITIAGAWSLVVATSQMGISCASATLSLTLHDTSGITVGGALLLPPDTLVLGSTTGCGTSSPFATTTLTDVQGKSANGNLTLWLFPHGAIYPQLRLDGNQSDAKHMAGLLSELNIAPWTGSTIGSWSAAK
jgi:hypothetical protein